MPLENFYIIGHFRGGFTLDKTSLTINKHSWDEAATRFFGRNPLPEYGPLAPSEEELNLFGDVSGLRVLDVGCGSGHSLKYMNDHGANELWGLDLSTAQITAAQKVLEKSNVPFHLFESPMEENPGLPRDYFDIVYSIYALGWTTNMKQTLQHIHTYLKKDGVFIFSWEHPLHNRIRRDHDTFTVAKSYHEEGSYKHPAWKEPAYMQQYRISTYINLLIETGFRIEQLIEDVALTEEDREHHENRWYSYDQAKLIPTTFIMKCTKK